MSNGEEKSIEFRIIYEWKDAHEDAICSYLFVEDRDLLVTASYDDSVKIWKMSRGISGKIDFQKEPKLLKKIVDFRDEDPNLLLRWDDSTFLTGTDDGTAMSYSLDYPFERKKVFFLVKMVNEYGMDDAGIPVSRRAFDDFGVLSISKVLCSNDRGQKSPSKIQDFVVLCKFYQKIVSKNDRNSNNFFSVISYSEEKILYHHELPTDKFGIASYSKHTSSKSVPNAIFVQTGKVRSRIFDGSSRKEFDNSVLMMDIISGEVLKVYKGRTSYGFDNFLDSNGKEYLICEGLSDMLFLCDVETALILRCFTNTSITSSDFLRLGERHYLLGEDDNAIDLFNVLEPKKEDDYDSIDVDDDDEGIKIFKPDGVFKRNINDDHEEEYDCLGLLTNLKKKKGKMGQYQVGDEIIFIANSSSGKVQHIIGIKNLDNIVLLEEERDSEAEQSLKDMQERLEYLLFDENRYYVGEREEFTLFVSGQVVLKHSILRLLL